MNSTRTAKPTEEGAVPNLQLELETLRASNAALQDELKRCRSHNASLRIKLDRYRNKNAALRLKFGLLMTSNTELKAQSQRLDIGAPSSCDSNRPHDTNNNDVAVGVTTESDVNVLPESPVTIACSLDEMDGHGKESDVGKILEKDSSIFLAKRKHDEMASAESLINHCAFMM